MDLRVVEFIKEPNETRFIELWNFNADMAMKCLFYILDQKQDTETFIDIYVNWVFEFHRKTFMKTLSLILGVYNNELLSEDEIKTMAKLDFEENERRLQLVQEDYRDSFRKEFISRVRKTYFTDVYRLPVYGNEMVVRQIQKRLLDDTIVFHTVETILKRYSKNLDKNQKLNFEEQYLFVTA